MAPKRSCRGTTASGDPCKAPEAMVDPETGLCPSHSEGASERLSEAGRKGAEATARKLKGKALDEGELPPLDSAHAAETWCDTVGRAVVTGRIGHNQGQAALRAVREWRESHDAGRLSDRLEALTDALSEWRKTGDPSPVLELVDGGS